MTANRDRKQTVVTRACLLLVTAAALPAAPVAAQEQAKVEVQRAQATAVLDVHKKKEQGFPDFGFMVSQQDYVNHYSDQPIFRLKADFPKIKPGEIPAFLKDINFMTQPLDYLLAVRDYAFEGNLPDWDPYNNKVRSWYHIPWLHPTTVGPNAYPPNGGTEGFRGLIKEAPATPFQLGPDQAGKDGNYSIYAITLVNDQAGYTLGKMWADPNNPDPRTTDARYGGGFPVGTVFAKLLFTDAPQGTDKIAYLENPLQWKAYITENFWKSDKRVVAPVNLLQMDIAVRDARAEGPGRTGWVFGTFVYNGQLNRPNKFMNLVPIGLTWGNDPENKVNTTNPFPTTETKPNPDLKETVIFASKELPPQHLGWNGRLNGPADLNTTFLHVVPYHRAISCTDESDSGRRGARRRQGPAQAGRQPGLDEVVPKYPASHFHGSARLLDRLFVPGGHRLAEFLHREKRSGTGRVGERIYPVAQADRTRGINALKRTASIFQGIPIDL